MQFGFINPLLVGFVPLNLQGTSENISFNMNLFILENLPKC